VDTDYHAAGMVTEMAHLAAGASQMIRNHGYCRRSVKSTTVDHRNPPRVSGEGGLGCRLVSPGGRLLESGLVGGVAEFGGVSAVGAHAVAVAGDVEHDGAV
jgi:hypothetical protein